MVTIRDARQQRMSAIVRERRPTRAARSMRPSRALRTLRRVITTTFIELPTTPTIHSAGLTSPLIRLFIEVGSGEY